jgi:hypothetical protein
VVWVVADAVRRVDPAVDRRVVDLRVVPVVDLRAVPLVDLRVVVRLAAGLVPPWLLVVAIDSLAPLFQDIRCRGHPCLVSIEHMFVPQASDRVTFP